MPDEQKESAVTDAMALAAMREFSAQKGESHDAMWDQLSGDLQREAIDEWRAILECALGAAPLASAPTLPTRGELVSLVRRAWNRDADGPAQRAEHVVDDILAALPASAPVPESPSPWRPIATAPRDGTHILVTVLDKGGFGYCGGKRQDWCAVVHYWPHEGEEGFYLSTGAAGFDDRPMDCTHWIPLPTERNAI